MKKYLVIVLFVILPIGTLCLLSSSPKNSAAGSSTQPARTTAPTIPTFRAATSSSPLWHLGRSPATSTSAPTASPSSPTLSSTPTTGSSSGPIEHPPSLAPPASIPLPAPVATPPPPVTTATTSPPAAPTGGWTYDQGEKVAWCEERGFENAPAYGPTYFGWLGISAGAWSSICHSTDYYSVAENLKCAGEIQAYPPDQNGCTGSW